MYCILVYDINEKRVAKILKLMRGYLNWIQNSVFEGELSKGMLDELMFKAGKIIHKEEDSIIIYTLQNQKFLDKLSMGIDKSEKTSNFL
ncbi:MAG: CRISPR-associated endonuclease Cas2 [Candidatus Kapabacteria bacterium]|nr:CRISPR-associated endonuclease Cas2 [Candidatus Kapabacteria bacterium]